MSAAAFKGAKPQRRVLVGDLQVGQGPNLTIITYALGSCVGLFAWHPDTLQGGCLHYKLPRCPDPTSDEPFKYGDRGIPTLIRSLAHSASDARRLRLVACGGASLAVENGTRRVGQRNIAILKKFLWKHGLVLAAHDLGGSTPRTVELDLATGQVAVQARHSLEIL